MFVFLEEQRQFIVTRAICRLISPFPSDAGHTKDTVQINNQLINVRAQSGLAVNIMLFFFFFFLFSWNESTVSSNQNLLMIPVVVSSIEKIGT